MPVVVWRTLSTCSMIYADDKIKTLFIIQPDSPRIASTDVERHAQ